MAPQIIYLPDGQTFTVTPVFGGAGFKSHEHNTHNHAFPIGWTIVLHTEELVQDGGAKDARATVEDNDEDAKPTKRIRTFRTPSLQNDALFISSISNPSSSEFKPAASPTRQIAMMLWITLYWYFHQPEPSLFLETEASKLTPAHARPKGEWKINIKRDGILRGRNLIPKLERMGLIASVDTAVGTSIHDADESWAHMFVSKRMFWQIPGRLFLFTLQPNRATSSFPGSPATSRPGSPSPTDSSYHYRQNQSQLNHSGHQRFDSDHPGGSYTVLSSHTPPIGPFYSSSHLPTYYPPAPLQYTFTKGIRHPLRPKPPRMGESFYARYIPSVGQYLSFRVASNSPKPVPHLGPVTQHKTIEHSHLCLLSDTALLQTWMAIPRVKAFWGDYTPGFLDSALSSPHSFPVIGLWDGVPFGYFEVYWVKEDILGQQLGNESGDFDRGLHVMVGEEWARGRIPSWLGGLIHWCLSTDFRTNNVCLEPRIDNERFVERLQQNGLSKEKQVSLPHKQSWYVRMRRETWEGPAL